MTLYEPFKVSRAELYRRANENLAELAANKYKPKPEKVRVKKLTELERATEDDLKIGKAILELRELRGGLWGELIVKPDLTPEENAAIEELDHQVEQLQDFIGELTKKEMTYHVRVYNKSRKVVK